MENVAKILRLIQERGVKQSHLENLINGYRGKISDWKYGKSLPTEQELEILANFFNVPVEFFSERVEEGLSAHKNSKMLGYNTNNIQPISNVRPIYGGVIEVPVFSKMTAVCGGRGFNLEDVQDEIAWWEPIPESWINGYPTGPAQIYVSYLEGDSMEPLIEDGERILINPNMEANHGDIAVLTWNGRKMVRGIKFDRDGSVRLCPVNKPKYEEDLIPSEDIEYVLKFEGVVMRFLGKDRVSRGIL